MAISTTVSWRVVNAPMGCTSSFLNPPNHDSAGALSEHTPTLPIDALASAFASASSHSREVNRPPRSELIGFRLNSDYAEVCVKPRNRGFACAGGGRWLIPRLNEPLVVAA